jgi:chromosome segregation ATPase
VDLEAELTSALSDLKRERRKNKSLEGRIDQDKGEFSKPKKNFEEVQHIIIKLKVQLEEAKVIEETLKNQLEEKKKINESLEDEIVSLRKEIQKKDV